MLSISLLLLDCSSSPNNGGDDGDAVDTGLFSDVVRTDRATSPDVGGDGSQPPETIRFAIEVANDVPESIWVQLNSEDGQPAWVVASSGDTRIYFEERCGIPDCDQPSGVCGAAMPMVRDITDAGFEGVIDLHWTGKTSLVDTSDDCERREHASFGDYAATFCWSLQAEVTGEGDPAEGVAGTLINPICRDVRFTLPDDDNVVYGIWGG